MTEPTVDLVGRALDDVDPIVAAISREQYESPTPCAEFDVRTLLAHLIGGLRGFAGVGEGGELRMDLDPDLDREDPLEEYRAAGGRIREAWSAAGVIEHEYSLPWGAMTGAQILGFTFIEVLTHGWDLARACGMKRTIDPELATAALEMSRQWVDDGARTPMLFGAEVTISDTAPAPDRLAAFLGRTP